MDPTTDRLNIHHPSLSNESVKFRETNGKKAVKKVNEYRHIELGAANSYQAQAKRKSIFARLKGISNGRETTDKNELLKKEHSKYEMNQYRYKVLERTLDKLIEEKGFSSGSSSCIDFDMSSEKKYESLRIYLNDIDEAGLANAKSHLLEYIEKNHKPLQEKIFVEVLHGDMFELDLTGIEPNSVDLKNPGAAVIEYSNLSIWGLGYDEKFKDESLILLAKQCSACDNGSLRLIYSQLRLKDFIDDLMVDAHNGDLPLEITECTPDKDMTYNLPEKHFAHGAEVEVEQAEQEENLREVLIKHVEKK